MNTACFYPARKFLAVKEVLTMEPKRDGSQVGKQPLSEPAQHVAGAHQLLKTLSEKFGEMKRYPELEEAISKLELALSALTVNTGGMF
jgi:hypothetical protein